MQECRVRNRLSAQIYVKWVTIQNGVLVRPLSESVTVLDGCDPSVASGIAAFMNVCTPSYTTRSKSFSIWTLIQQHVEPPLSAYLRGHGLLPYPDCFGRIGLADAMKKDLETAEQSLRSYIRLSMRTRWDKTFQATLESVLYLVYFCKGRVPTRSVGRNPKRGAVQKTVLKKFDGMQYPYCELCWRLCQHEDQSCKTLEGVRRSVRFCSEHAPIKSTSQYRTDHNHRAKFHAKLKEVYKELPFQKGKWMDLAGDIDETSIRRYAYEFVHSHLVDDRLEVIRLSEAGHANVDIAKRLNISRQMVHKILNNPLKGNLGRTIQGRIIYFAGGKIVRD